MKRWHRRDILNRFEWLFRDNYVDESADELHDDARDLEKREERICKATSRCPASNPAVAGDRWNPGFGRDGKSGEYHWLAYGLSCVPPDEVQPFVLATQLSGANSWARKNLVFGTLGALPDDTRTNLLRGMGSSLSQEAFARLLELAPFRRSTWLLVDELEESARNTYWSNVRPTWMRVADEDLSEAVESLLKAKRPRAAFNCVHIAVKELRPSLLFRLMTEIATGGEEPTGQYQLEPYYIDRAFALLDKSGEFSTEQMAGLEFPIRCLGGEMGRERAAGYPSS